MRILLVGAGAAVSTVDVERGYRDALRELGVEVFEYDLGSRLGLAKRWLQRLWTARGKDPSIKPTWGDTLYQGSKDALERALAFEVDWVVVISGMFMHPDALVLMRRAGLRTAVLFTESPYDDDGQARVAQLVDVCWTNERSSVPRLKKANPYTFYVRHAYDPARHAPARSLADVPAHDVVFVGTGFEERIEQLERVDWEGIDLGLYGSWALLRRGSPLRQYLKGGLLHNDQTVELYRCAKIGLNLYRSSSGYGRNMPRVEGAESMNPRAYELAACAVFQLAERRLEQTETFGWSIPTFESPFGLQVLVRRFLADPIARQHCVAAARERVRPHTFAARAAQLVADLESTGARPKIPAVAGLRGA